jgi:hypothetical protein
VEDVAPASSADLQVWETRMLNQIYCKVVSAGKMLQDLAAQNETDSRNLHSGDET